MTGWQLTDTGLVQQSKGHLGFSGVWEFFEIDGDLYKAPIAYEVNELGYRSGARFEAFASSNDGDDFASWLEKEGFDALR